MKSGRKSTAALSVVTPLSTHRIAPPEHLTHAQAKQWREIVDSLPADYLRPGDVPLLSAYCCASSYHQQAHALLEAEGMVLTNERGNAQVHPAVAILTAQAANLASLATKLRLCPSSRYDKHKAANMQRGAGLGARPWEREGE